MSEKKTQPTPDVKPEEVKPEEVKPEDVKPDEIEFDGSSLYRGALVSYVGADEQPQSALVVDLFEADGVAHARVAHLPATLALPAADLTPITN